MSDTLTPQYYFLNDPFTYPLSIGQVKAKLWEENPNTAFATPFVPPDHFIPVYPTIPPVIDSRYQMLVEAPAPILKGDRYEVAYEVKSLPEEEVSAAFAERKSVLVANIDTDADSIYVDALGNRATEYAEAEIEARAFKSVNYEGVVPPYVQAWASATGNTAQWATDDIIATADAWRTAQTAIRAHRLDCKEQARRATTQAELDTVSTAWAALVTSIKAQLGIAL